MDDILREHTNFPICSTIMTTRIMVVYKATRPRVSAAGVVKPA